MCLAREHGRLHYMYYKTHTHIRNIRTFVGRTAVTSDMSNMRSRLAAAANVLFLNAKPLTVHNPFSKPPVYIAWLTSFVQQLSRLLLSTSARDKLLLPLVA